MMQMQMHQQVFKTWSSGPWSSGWTGGRQEKLHPGFWKIPPRVWVQQEFWKIPPRFLENPTQGSGKLQNLHEPCDYTFLDKQVSEEKLKKWRRYVELNMLNHLYVCVKKVQFIY